MHANLPKRFVSLFLFFIVAIWIFLSRDFLSGAVSVNLDALVNLETFKYFYNNLFNGVIPLWDPFIYLGRPHVVSFIGGPLNILVLPVYALYFLGVDYYNLYLLYMFLYFLLGVWGFFKLSNIILKNDSYALVACSFLVFSGLPETMFNQFFFILLFVPGTWFFVFCLKFFKNYQLFDFWGIICTLMLMGVLYFPFYFVCLALIFLLFYALIFYDQVGQKIMGLLGFMKAHKVMTCIGICAVCMGFIPLLLFRMVNSTGEILSPFRQQCEIVDSCPANVEMDFEEVAFFGSFGERFAGGALFSHLDKFNFNNDSFIYVSTLAFIFVALAMLTIMDRKTRLILAMGCSIFLLSLGGITPIYKFLFDHVFFFKYFRNLFFFAGYIIPIFILFAVVQLKSVVEQITVVKNKVLALIFIVCGHVAFYGLLRFQGDILPATYMTVLLSLLVFMLLLRGAFEHRPYVFLFLMLALILIEPVNVFQHYRSTAALSSFPMSRHHIIPEFKYTRPLKNDRVPAGISGYAMYSQLANFKDASPIINFQPDYLSSYVFKFYKFTPEDQYIKRSQNKIAVYPSGLGSGDAGVLPIEILADSEEFKILHFDVNSLKVKTNFVLNKFLVYRDAYSVFWKVFINGQEAKVSLAEDVFKGVEVPAGENTIEFRYSPPGGQGIYIFVLVCMALAFLMLGGFYLKSRSGQSTCC